MSSPVDDAPSHGELASIEQQHDFDLGDVDLHSLLIEVWHRLARGDRVDETSEMITIGDAVAEHLTTALDIHNNRFSRERYFDLFGMFQHDLDEPRPPIEGASYVDLGCGSVNPYGFGLLMLMLGASSCVGIDLEEVEDPARAARGLARLVDVTMQDPSRVIRGHPITREEVLRNLHDVDLPALRRGELSARGPRLHLHRASAEALPLDAGSVDVVVSNSFLEHVDDIDAVLDEIARVTTTGGFSVHAIDGMDHWSYGDPHRGPLDFLRKPEPGMVHGSNRIRALEFPALFEQHGFTVQQVVARGTVPVTDEEVAQLAMPWRAMPREVLETVYVTVVARRR